MKSKIIIFLTVFLTINSFAQNEDFRSNIDVIHYDINLNITDFVNKKIKGNTVVKLKPKNTAEIKLELLNLHVDSVFVFNNKMSDFKYDGKIITIPYHKTNQKNYVLINIFYQGQPVEDLAWGGFFFSDSTAYNIGVGMEATPHGFGRVWFPCSDSFTDKATYNLNITVPQNYRAVCSGILEKTKINENKTETYSWVLKQEVPTYIVSVAVAKYSEIKDVYEGIKRNIPISLFVYPNDSANAVYSFKNLKKALSAFEHGYGEYVWDRVGYVEVPFSSGAMEHVCNIAYPEYAIDSTLFRETLMAHELSHHWFGNLVTCKTASDMWLNEGWASYSEALFKEDVYGKQAYKEYVRENHAKVLTQAHIIDKGYRAVAGVPHEFTYGMTVYDKGADVAYTLRGYMGDSLFFSSLTAYLKTFAFKAASSYDFRDFLSHYSGIDLTDFFETWVFEKGFPHFSISSFKSEKIGKEYKTDLILKQRLKERDLYGQNNLVDITFVDKDLNFYTEKAIVSKPEETFNYFHKFKPLYVFIDLEEKNADATIDNYKLFKDTASYDFPYTDFSVKINSLKGKAIIQSVLNIIEPENIKNDDYNFSKVQYWDINGVATEKITMEGSFFVSMQENNFSEFLDEAVLLYRPNIYTPFKKVDTELFEYNEFDGLFIVKNLKFGQYAIAVEK
ncbi:MAG: M1 family metallopeptidase [Chlorobi bacterium]|nr:M1 family metallopeptidase [Chlorobiota bacterium]